MSTAGHWWISRDGTRGYVSAGFESLRTNPDDPNPIRDLAGEQYEAFLEQLMSVGRSAVSCSHESPSAGLCSLRIWGEVSPDLILGGISFAPVQEYAISLADDGLSHLVNSSPYLFYVLRDDLSTVYASKQTEEAFGLPASEITGESWRAQIHPDDWETTQALWAQRRNLIELAFRFRRCGESDYRWHIGRAKEVVRHDYHVEGPVWFCSCTDVEELFRSRQYLEITKTMLDVSVQPTAAIDPSGMILAANPAFWRAKEEKELPAGWHQDGRLVQAEVAKALGLSEPASFCELPELETKTKIDCEDQSLRFFQVKVSPRQQTDYSYLKYTVIALNDVTELQAQEEVLSERNKLLEQIATSLPDILYLYDITDGRNIYVNGSLAAQLGWNESEVQQMGSSMMQHLLHPDDRSIVLQSHQQLNEPTQTGVVQCEYRFLHRDGTYRWLRSRDVVMERNEDGTCRIVLGIATMIHEQRVASERLKELAEELVATNESLMRARDQALEASRAKSLFLANMSHEIRTPMNGILGSAELLLDRAADDEARELIGTISRSGRSLLRILNDILDLSKIEANRLDLAIAPTEITELVRDAGSLYAASAQEKGLELILELPEEPVWVGADSLRLNQIVGNLITNAIKFTNKGHVQVTLQATRNGADTDVTISVRDTGIGISGHELDRIFEPFTQVARGGNHLGGGTGLGLTICRRLAELMGGQLSGKSRKEKGSDFQFRVTLPVAIPRSKIVIDSEDRIFALRVLLAEDNPVNVAVVKRMLTQLGATVEVVENGLQAIRALEENRFDVVFMDVQMPICNGLEATRAIRYAERKSAEHIPIIALTANARPEDERACLEAGMDSFVAKPVSLADLRWALGQHFGGTNRSAMTDVS